MVQLTIDMPEGALSSLRQDSDNFVRELRLAAAIKRYEMRRISQGRAAEIAGISRSEFITALGQFGVSPFQYDVDEMIEEVHGHCDHRTWETDKTSPNNTQNQTLLDMPNSSFRTPLTY